MLRSITNVIFGLMAVMCVLAGLFWVWFLYEYSLKWLKYGGNIPVDAGATAVWGEEGAWWVGGIAVGWFVVAIFFWIIHRRMNKKNEPELENLQEI